MKEHQERLISDIQNLESKAENVEQRMEQLENSIKNISETISRLEDKGDQEVASAIRKNLNEKQLEKTLEEQNAQTVANELLKVQDELRSLEKLNDESNQEVKVLESLGENVGDANSIIGLRKQWIEGELEKVNSLQQRLNELIRNNGW